MQSCRNKFDPQDSKFASVVQRQGSNQPHDPNPNDPSSSTDHRSPSSETTRSRMPLRTASGVLMSTHVVRSCPTNRNIPSGKPIRPQQLHRVRAHTLKIVSTQLWLQTRKLIQVPAPRHIHSYKEHQAQKGIPAEYYRGQKKAILAILLSAQQPISSSRVLQAQTACVLGSLARLRALLFSPGWLISF